MKYFKLAETFSRNEDGAGTVDWLVLTAAVVGLSVAVLTSVSSGSKTLGEVLSSDQANRPVITY